MIPEVFSNGETDMVVEREDEGDDEPIVNQDEEDELNYIESNMSASEAASVPTTAKLQVQVQYRLQYKPRPNRVPLPNIVRTF